MSEAQRWAVVGGGFLGASMARDLRKKGHSVTLFEAADHLGGLADTWSLGDVHWDRHYHVFLESDLRTLDLVRELGLEEEIGWGKTKTGFFTDGRLLSMSNALEFLRFPPLGLLSKFRLGLTILYCSRIEDGTPLEQELVSDWLTRWSGRRAYEKIWRPLLKAKLGDQHSEASASFIWAIIRRMYSARRQGAKTERLGYLKSGYSKVLGRLAEQLEELGVELALGKRVESVRAGSQRLQRVRLSDGREHEFDRVVVTLASPLAARLCRDLTSDERERMQAVRYQGVLCESVLLDRPLSEFYVTNITDEWVPFTGVIEMSALVPRQLLGNRSLVYLPRYLPPDHEDFELTDDALREDSVRALERMYPGFSAERIVAHRVSRARWVTAISTLNYSETMPGMLTSSDGLYTVGSAHINNGTLNVDETLQLSERALGEILTASAQLGPAPAASLGVSA